MKRDKIKTQMAFCYSLIIIIGVIPFFCGKLYYVAGDDYIMNYIARGTFGGGINEHVPFVNIIIGKIWKWLYQLTDNMIDWMVMTYLLTILLCGFICFHILKRHIKNIGALIIALSLEVFCVGWLTFTTIAYISFLSGFMLLCESDRISSNKKRLLCTILSSLMIVYSFCIRMNAFKSCVFMMLPIFVVYIRKNWKKYVGIVIVIAGCVLLFNTINTLEYNSKEWSKYNEWNSARWQVLDYEIDSYEKNPKLYKKIGFSENDYKGIDCICADNKVYAPEKLKYIVKKSKNRKSINILKNIVKMLKMKELWIFTFLFLLGTLLSKRKIVNLYIYFAVCALVQYLFFIGRPILRVTAVLFFVGQILIIYNIVRHGVDKDKYYKYKIVVIAALPVFMGVFALKQSYSIAEHNREKHNGFSEIYEYANNNRDKLFVLNGDDKLCYWSSVNIVDSKPNFENVESTCSYRLYSDNYYSHLSKYKLKEIDRLIVNVIKILEKYVEEHTGREILVEPVKRISDINTTIYNIRNKNDSKK